MKIKQITIFSISAALTAWILLLGVGCGKKAISISRVEAKPAAPKPLDLNVCRPNEVGFIPILEYHELTSDGATPRGYQFPIDSFRKDMERLYSLGYRPISLHDFLKGKIDVPLGRSPVIITFDDALPGQIYFNRDGSLSADCAAGVLLTMHHKHSDWPVHGVFYILTMRGTEEYFFQKEWSQQKLQWLVDNGFEIGNHTLHHFKGMNTWPDSRAMTEIAGGAKMIQKHLPGYPVDTIALPYGVYPHNRKLVIKGESGGYVYSNIAAFRAGYNPALPPWSKKYNSYELPRIIPGDGSFEIEWWLSQIEKHPKDKYISDGDPWTVTIPASYNNRVAIKKVQKEGLFFRTYANKKTTTVEASAKGT